LANIDAVTVGDIKAVAEEFFMTEKIAFASLGDLSDMHLGREKLEI
jgi:hypothetical protein